MNKERERESFKTQVHRTSNAYTKIFRREKSIRIHKDFFIASITSC